jgi:hypothetical protein
MDLFQAVPALRRHPDLQGKRIALVGVSSIVRDDSAVYFEIGKPKYWRPRDDGVTVVGVGGIGGSIEAGETVQACLRREVAEEMGARVRLEPAARTFLINEWQVVDEFEVAGSKKRLPPLMVILVPPRLGGPDTPDHLAILVLRARLRDAPTVGDLLGLLRIEEGDLAAYFGPDEVPLQVAETMPGVTVSLGGPLPDPAVLRPVLTGRAFQLLVRAGYEGPSKD